MIEYPNSQDTRICTPEERAVEYLMGLRWEQEQKVDKRLAKYGITDSDTGVQRRVKEPSAQYGAICFSIAKYAYTSDQLTDGNPAKRRIRTMIWSSSRREVYRCGQIQGGLL